MKKRLLVGGAVIAVLLARRCASSCGGFDFEKLVERMPDNAPPKWMFSNINAIRENTDRILHLIESERPSTTGEEVRPAE